MKNTLALLILLVAAFPGFSQNIGYDVFGSETHPFAGTYSVVTLDTLQEASTLSDLRFRYPASWVAKYNYVEISSRCEGGLRKATGPSDRLTDEQLRLIKHADAPCRIDIEVDYLPKNTLKDNPPRKMNFSVTFIPIFEAKYPGEASQLKAYLKANIIDRLPAPNGEPVKFAKASFVITPQGRVSEARMAQSSGDESIDRLILSVLNAMQDWIPAKNAQGKEISQEFEFTVGTDLLRCDYVY